MCKPQRGKPVTPQAPKAEFAKVRDAETSDTLPGVRVSRRTGYTTVPLGGPTDDRQSDTSPLSLEPRDMGLDEIFDLTTGTAGWEPMRTTRTPAEWPAPPIGSWLGASGEKEVRAQTGQSSEVGVT